LEYAIEYGLFLAKAITLVIAILFVISGIAATVAKPKSRPDDEGQLVIRHLSKEYETLSKDVREQLLSEAEQKKLAKQRKKDEKQQRKAEKKSLPFDDAKQKDRVFVLDFDGDINASAVETLRREISALLQVSDKKDEVVLRLESPGGVVHGYGLAASQLDRIRQQGIKLTICVDKVAASGGYMMACIGDRILSAPFAILGSIGVVAQIPNFHRLLKKNDVDIELVTAGEFKRTLTMFGENTDQGRTKFQEELDEAHQLFKDFVRDHRRNLNMDEVATGEHWFGVQAKELGLVDELMTSDEYLEKRSKEAEVFHLGWQTKKRLAERLGFAFEATVERLFLKVLQKSNRHLL